METIDIQYHNCSWEGCNYQTKKPSRLRVHMRIHSDERPYICTQPNCDKTFKRSDHLSRHLQAHRIRDFSAFLEHQPPAPQSEEPHADRNPSDDDEGEEEASSLLQADQHLSLQLDQRLSSLPPHAAPALFSRIPCPHAGCPSTFLLPQHLRRHLLKLHDLSARLACAWPGCAQSFTRKSLLQRHVASHSNQLPFPCPHCPLAFAQPCLMRRHVARRHEARHTCTVQGCEAGAFLRFCDLTAHRREAHPPAPVACSACGQTFATRDRLRSHCKTKHLEGGGAAPAPAAPVACVEPGCGKTYAKKSNMMAHYRSAHQSVRDFACPREGCGAAFATASGLSRHEGSVHRKQRGEEGEEEEEEEEEAKRPRVEDLSEEDGGHHRCKKARGFSHLDACTDAAIPMFEFPGPSITHC